MELFRLRLPLRRIPSALAIRILAGERGRFLLRLGLAALRRKRWCLIDSRAAGPWPRDAFIEPPTGLSTLSKPSLTLHSPTRPSPQNHPSLDPPHNQSPKYHQSSGNGRSNNNTHRPTQQASERASLQATGLKPCVF